METTLSSSIEPLSDTSGAIVISSKTKPPPLPSSNPTLNIVVQLSVASSSSNTATSTSLLPVEVGITTKWYSLSICSTLTTSAPSIQ
jgi:hypothetical protein